MQLYTAIVKRIQTNTLFIVLSLHRVLLRTKSTDSRIAFLSSTLGTPEVRGAGHLDQTHSSEAKHENCFELEKK